LKVITNSVKGTESAFVGCAFVLNRSALGADKIAGTGSYLAFIEQSQGQRFIAWAFRGILHTGFRALLAVAAMPDVELGTVAEWLIRQWGGSVHKDL
jgi:hypothetical protein